MSTFFDSEVKCGCCGEKVKITRIGSTFCVGYSDLDTRPPSMRRWTMSKWVQACPHCGYVHRSLDKKIPFIKSFVKSKKYTECDGLNVKNTIARRFVRWALICARTGRLKDEMNAYLCAAWACDDHDEPKTAVILRTRCELLLKKLMKREKDEQLCLMDADLLRRSGQFDEVIRRYTDIPPYVKDEKIKEALRFEINKAKLKNMRGFKFSKDGIVAIENWGF